MKRPLGHKSRRGFPWRLRLSQLELSWETLRSRRRVASSVGEGGAPSFAERVSAWQAHQAGATLMSLGAATRWRRLLLVRLGRLPR